MTKVTGVPEEPFKIIRTRAMSSSDHMEAGLRLEFKGITSKYT